MHLTSVTYRRLKTLSGYNNETVGGTAEVEPGESSEAAFTELKAWVEAHLSIAERHDELAMNVSALESKQRYLQSNVTRLERRWEQAKAFLEKHGLPVESMEWMGEDDDGMPF